MISVPTLGSMLTVIGVTLLAVALLSAAIGALFTRRPEPVQLARPSAPAEPATQALPGQRAAADDDREHAHA